MLDMDIDGGGEIEFVEFFAWWKRSAGAKGGTGEVTRNVSLRGSNLSLRSTHAVCCCLWSLSLSWQRSRAVRRCLCCVGQF